MGSAVLGDLLAEGHGHGSRPQHHQECDDGTHCLLEALATYIPREDFFFFLIQSNLATGSIVQYLLGKAFCCPLSLPSRTVCSLLACLHFKKCTPRGTWSSSEEFTDATSERNPPTVQVEAQLEREAF